MTTYLTVAIPYVNAQPHLGYAYELVLADIHARARRLAGEAVRFLGGTDDHSLKNVLAAEAAGVPTRRFVDDHAAAFEALAEPLGVSFDDFIRTSADDRHVPAVERLWRACAAGGDLYRRAYEGDYCVGCEQFYALHELDDGRCPEHGTPTEAVAEENWFFRLSAYQCHIEDLVRTGQLAIRPEAFRQEVLGWLRRGLEDISVSRSVERARGWGISVPGDPTQVVYVWFDALTNYLSALRFGEGDSEEYQRWWVESDRRVHVVGKGILRFHALYWPAFLASAGEPPPTAIQVHPYLTVGGQKLSKSRGTTADPVGVAASHGTDALRWWFARDIAAVADTDFGAERLVERANQDLANGLGNVTNRIATIVYRHRNGVVPDVEAEPIDAAQRLGKRVLHALADFDLRRATRLVVSAVASLDRDLEVTQPWQLARAEAQGCEEASAELDRVLSRQVRSAVAIANAVAPIVPDLSARLLSGLAGDGRIPKPEPVFPRIDAGER